MTFKFEKLMTPDNIDIGEAKIFLEDWDADPSSYAGHHFIPSLNEIHDIDSYVRCLLKHTCDYSKITSVYYNLRSSLVEDTLYNLGGGHRVVSVHNLLDNESHYFKFTGFACSYDLDEPELDKGYTEVFATPVTVVQYLPKT
jgi:hypothetical protein